MKPYISQSGNSSRSDNMTFKTNKEPRMDSDSGEYEQRLASEKDFYKDCKNVSDLPPIFRYWADNHLMPTFKKFGFATPEHFFFREIERYVNLSKSENIRIISVGAGNCDVETYIAQHLIHENIHNFTIECLDINEDMLARGKAYTQENDVSKYISQVVGDFNNWVPDGKYNIVIANQSLHHVINLEGLFDAITSCLLPNGRFLVSDMIGRNGHQRWPEALKALAPFWDEMPDNYKYNQLLKRYEENYINYDCSTEGFEGIRSQDILPLLIDRFNFDLFLPFANIIMVFIDRAFGHNFNNEADWDRGFIDRVQKADIDGINARALSPTQMIASLCIEEVEMRKSGHLTPEFCVRAID